VRGALAKGFTRSDLAKYPFLKASSAYVSSLGLDIKALSTPALSSAISRALGRVKEAIRFGKIGPGLSDEVSELLSFPIAVAMISAVGNEYLKRRYALAEAKRAEELLAREPVEKLLSIAEDFGWRIKPIEALSWHGFLYEFSLSLPDYLKNASLIKDKRWKLVNRHIVSGGVLITRAEMARLLAEEVRRRVEGILSKPIKEVPAPLVPHVERVRALLSELKAGEAIKLEESGELFLEAFPPCMKAIYVALSERKHVPHAGRFAFTAFLLHIGMSVDDVVELFRQVADFSERITRYQVEHIAGERGGKVRYTPPSCDAMRSYGLCVGADELCAKIRHPLSYYARRARELKRRAKKTEEGKAEGGESGG